MKKYTRQELETLRDEYINDMLDGCDLETVHKLAYEWMLSITPDATEETDLLKVIMEHSPYLLDDPDCEVCGGLGVIWTNEEDGGPPDAESRTCTACSGTGVVDTNITP